MNKQIFVMTLLIISAITSFAQSGGLLIPELILRPGQFDIPQRTPQRVQETNVVVINQQAKPQEPPIIVKYCEYNAIGLTESQIKEVFNGNISVNYIDSGRVLVAKIGQSQIIYGIEDGICFMSAIIPGTDKELNAIIKRYNQSYTAIDNNTWMTYSMLGVLSIKLLWTPEGCVFIRMPE